MEGKNKHTKKIERWNTKNPTGKEEKQTNKVGKKEGKKENISLESVQTLIKSVIMLINPIICLLLHACSHENRIPHSNSSKLSGFKVLQHCNKKNTDH